MGPKPAACLRRNAAINDTITFMTVCEYARFLKNLLSREAILPLKAQLNFRTLVKVQSVVDV